MKNLILIVLLTLFATIACAQTRNIDTALKFDKVITAFERHWVVLKKPDTVPYYTFGYVYIQSDKGFMFKPGGQFEIAKNNKYLLQYGKSYRYRFSADDADSLAQARVIRLLDTNGGQNPRQIRLPIAAILPPKHFKELKIEAEPQWVKPYYTYIDTLEHNYKWGCYHYEEIDFSTGISYWEKVYKVSPHYKGVPAPMDRARWLNTQGIEMKLGEAYNYDKAIPVLKGAIAYNPANLGFYILLNNVYEQKGDLPAAINACKQGLAQIKVDKSEFKCWFAGVISNAYIALKDEEQGKYWRKKSDEYNPRPGVVY